jgi:hypothetical protein
LIARSGSHPEDVMAADRCRTRTLPLLFALLLSLVTHPAATAEDRAPDDAERRARLIARLLERGRVGAARVEAEGAVRRFPEAGVLHRRLAQVRLCQVLEQDRALDRAVEAIRQAQAVRRVASVLDYAPSAEGISAAAFAQALERQREARAKLLTPENLAQIGGFHTRAVLELQAVPPLVVRRHRELLRSREAVAEARRRGDDSAELALTELWTEALALLWRHEAQKLTETERTSTMLAVPSLDITPLAPPDTAQEFPIDRLLLSAAALAERYEEDPQALAGAADLILLVAQVGGRPLPLHAHSRALLHRRWMPASDAARYLPQARPEAQERARQEYQAARETATSEVLAAPEAVALALFRRAHAFDGEGSLPFLRLRLYLLIAPLDTAEAQSLLAELEELEPQNAAVLLERARAGYLLEGSGGTQHLYAAAGKKTFSRSYLTGVPTALRMCLRQQRELRDTEQRWPGYSAAVFQTLEEIQRPSTIRNDQLELLPQPQRDIQIRLTQLRLSLAELLLEAPDYGDQVLGVHEKARALRDLARFREFLSREEQARVAAAAEVHAARFAGLPRHSASFALTENGLQLASSYPELQPPTANLPRHGPRVIVHSSGLVLLGL